jgi:hypothetical protein
MALDTKPEIIKVSGLWRFNVVKDFIMNEMSIIKKFSPDFYGIISACSPSTGKTSVSHSERSRDEGGQYANKTNDEYGEIWASAVKLAKVLLLVLPIVEIKPIFPNTGEGSAKIICQITIASKIVEYLYI